MFTKVLIANRGENLAQSAEFRRRVVRAARKPEPNCQGGTKHVF